MSVGPWSRRLLTALAVSCTCIGAWAQAPRAGQTDRNKLEEPIYRVAQEKMAAKPTIVQNAPQQQAHPLDPAIDMATKAVDKILREIKDYTATVHKREQIGGVLQERETMFVKVRHQPFSVYLYFLSPSSAKGREVIYVAGKNNGNIIAHDVGLKGLVTLKLDPKGAIAMHNQRYPITELGFLNLGKQLVERAEQDKKNEQPQNCNVKFYNNAKIGDRPCTGVELIHDVQRPTQMFQKAVVFVDQEMGIPIHYASYDWPAKPGDNPALLEEYSYTNVKLNVGLTDADFDENNKEYHFH